MQDTSRPSVLGLIVNPIAGLGGAVGLHGTDGASWRRAVAMGAKPTANLRTKRAIDRIRRSGTEVAIVAAPGGMGTDVARRCDFTVTSTDKTEPKYSTAADTMAAARQMLERGVVLLMFAGGDGTATDIVSVVGQQIPILGVPSGVKMHSGVFGISPEAAGDIAASYLETQDPDSLRVVDVLDVAPDSEWAPSKLGSARVPTIRNKIQQAKSSPSVHDDSHLDALCTQIARSMTDDRLYVIGPGTSTARILEALDAEATLNGFDVVLNRTVLARDASEAELFSLVSDAPEVSIILGVVGGQGFLLGRGNQQISPRVLGVVGEENISIVASAEKLLALGSPQLLVDVGNSEPIPAMSGYRRVRTGPRTEMVLKVVS